MKVRADSFFLDAIPSDSAMKLAAVSHAQLQSFLRYHFKDDTLNVPHIYVYTGSFARLITHTLKIGAITFGRRVLVSPALVERDELQQLIVPGWLVAHEAIHVLQYEQAGFIGFLVSYLKNYWRALLEQRGYGSAARMSAYLSIAEEQSAREAERAYRVWRADSSFVTGEK